MLYIHIVPTQPIPFKFNQSRDRSVTVSGERKEIFDLQKSANDNKAQNLKNKQSYMKSLNAAPFKVGLSDKKPTIPQPFNFKKSIRDKESDIIAAKSVVEEEKKEVKKVEARNKFQTMFAKKQEPTVMKVTQPIEFKFRTDVRLSQKYNAPHVPSDCAPAPKPVVVKPKVYIYIYHPSVVLAIFLYCTIAVNC